MKKDIYLIILILVLIILLFLNLFFYFNYELVDTSEFYANVYVSETAGFDLNTSSLTFGNVLRGGSSERTVSFYNDYGFDIVIDACGKGEIKKFIRCSEKKILKGENEKIKIIVSVPDNASLGFYEGSVVFDIRKS